MATHGIPLMPQAVTRLVAMLDNGEALVAVLDELIRTRFDCIEDSKWVEEGKDTLSLLLHSMSRPLIRSVLTNTLGPYLYDKIHCKDNWEQALELDGPGAYAMFSYVRDRKGKWLNGREIKGLIELLKEYQRAIEVGVRNREQDKCDASQLSMEDRRALSMGMKIDDAERVAKKELTVENDLNRFKPRFESGSEGSGDINALISMLGRRYVEGLDQEVWHSQSPLMVGNAGNMADHTSRHMPSNGFTNAPKLWGLMLSCIKILGIECDVGAVALFRAWIDDRQVNAAEVLGMVLAGSMVSVAGVNVKQPGTRSEQSSVEASALKASEEHICASKTWFTENLKYSMKAIEEHYARNDPECAALQKEIEEAEEELERRVNNGKRFFQQIDELDESIEEKYREIDQAIAEYRSGVEALAKELKARDLVEVEEDNEWIWEDLSE